MAENTRTGPTVADLKRRVGNLEGAPTDASAVAAEAQARAAGDKTLADAITAEAQARTTGVKTVADGLASETSRAKQAEADLAARLPVKLSGTLTLPAGLGLVGGKTIRTAAVTGLKAGDDIAVTPKVALPTGVAMGETYCAADGVLSVALITVGLVTISAKTDIALGVVALR